MKVGDRIVHTRIGEGTESTITEIKPDGYWILRADADPRADVKVHPDNQHKWKKIEILAIGLM